MSPLRASGELRALAPGAFSWSQRTHHLNFTAMGPAGPRYRGVTLNWGCGLWGTLRGSLSWREPPASPSEASGGTEEGLGQPGVTLGNPVWVGVYLPPQLPPEGPSLAGRQAGRQAAAPSLTPPLGSGTDAP